MFQPSDQTLSRLRSQIAISKALAKKLVPAPDYIGKEIAWLRGEKVLLDTDRAEFPSDFAFRLADHGLRTSMSQIATSNGAEAVPGKTREDKKGAQGERKEVEARDHRRTGDP